MTAPPSARNGQFPDIFRANARNRFGWRSARHFARRLSITVLSTTRTSGMACACAMKTCTSSASLIRRKRRGKLSSTRGFLAAETQRHTGQHMAGVEMAEIIQRLLTQQDM
jgi:hypothetical protein